MRNVPIVCAELQRKLRRFVFSWQNFSTCEKIAGNLLYTLRRNYSRIARISAAWINAHKRRPFPPLRLFYFILLIFLIIFFLLYVIRCIIVPSFYFVWLWKCFNAACGLCTANFIERTCVMLISIFLWCIIFLV